MSGFFKTLFGIPTINPEILEENNTSDKPVIKEFVKLTADELYSNKQNGYHLMMAQSLAKTFNYYDTTSASSEFSKLRRFYVKLSAPETYNEKTLISGLHKKIQGTAMQDFISELNNILVIVMSYQFNRFSNENILKTRKFRIRLNAFIDDLRYILNSNTLWVREEDFNNQAFVLNYATNIAELTQIAQELAADQLEEQQSRRAFILENYKQQLLKQQEREYHEWLKKQNRNEDRYDNIENEDIKKLLYSIEDLFSATSKVHDDLEVEEQYLIEEIMYNYIPESLRLLESFRVQGTSHRVQAENIIIQKLELFENQFNEILESEEKESLKKLEALLSSATPGTITGSEV